jgi:hypothetical protein
MSVWLDPNSEASRRAGDLARRLMTARVEAGDPATQRLYFETLSRIASDVADTDAFVHLLAAAVEVGYACLLTAALFEDSGPCEVW